MRDFQNSKDRPYIHLVDGGLGDNIGVRGVLEAFEELAASAEFREEVGFGVVRRIAIIVVNAHSSPSTDRNRKEKAPGMVAQILRSAGVPIERYSYETIELMKDRTEIASWRRELRVARYACLTRCLPEPASRSSTPRSRSPIKSSAQRADAGSRAGNSAA